MSQSLTALSSSSRGTRDAAAAAADVDDDKTVGNWH